MGREREIIVKENSFLLASCKMRGGRIFWKLSKARLFKWQPMGSIWLVSSSFHPKDTAKLSLFSECFFFLTRKYGCHRQKGVGNMLGFG